MSNLTGTQKRTAVELDRQVARQHGVIHRRQVLAMGFSKRMIQLRLQKGLWIRVHPSVYRLAGAPHTWQRSHRIGRPPHSGHSTSYDRARPR